MRHLDLLRRGSPDEAALHQRVSGRYYTGELVGRLLAAHAAATYHRTYPTATCLALADPFGGDGRLVEWFVDAWVELQLPSVRWTIAVWDIDACAVESAVTRIEAVVSKRKVSASISPLVVDSFAEALKQAGRFDVVLTNPPWELLKPDRRELSALASDRRADYVERMKAYDRWLAEVYPLSQPKRKFAGWGTNLSRVGLDAAIGLTRPGGLVAIVLPASFLADDQTSGLREHVLLRHGVQEAIFYPAEARLYGKADVGSMTLSLLVGRGVSQSITAGAYDVAERQCTTSVVEIDRQHLERVGFVIPLTLGPQALRVMHSLSLRFPTWGDLEGDRTGELWAGREIDETGIGRRLKPGTGGGPLFVKGRMIDRYQVVDTPSQEVSRPHGELPDSVAVWRIAWRDVSRPSQARRMIATLIEPGWIAGNSLGVAYFRGGMSTALLALLGIMNSTVFELQLRAHLATGHVSLSSIRKVAVPSASELGRNDELAEQVRRALMTSDRQAVQVDAYVARRIYGLTKVEYTAVLNVFPMPDLDRRKFLNAFDAIAAAEVNLIAAANAA